MKEQDLRRALDASITGCQPSEHWKRRVLAQTKEEKTLKRKLSVGLILAAALLLATATALVATGAFDRLWEVWQDSFRRMNTTGAVDILDEKEYEAFKQENDGVKEDWVVSTVPRGKDLDYDTAYAIARQAIIDKFGTPEAELDAMGVYPNFWNTPYQEDGDQWYTNEWDFYITPLHDVEIDLDHTYDPPGEYRVQIASPSGEVTLCNWYLDAFFPDYARRTWEAGKRDIVFSRAQNIQFYEQSAADQADFLSLFAEAGYDIAAIQRTDEEKLSMLELTLAFAEPEENLMRGEGDEIAAAIRAMEDASGITKEQLERFAFILLHSPLTSETKDYCFCFNYNVEEQLFDGDAGSLNRLGNFQFRAHSYGSRLGFYMICLDPETLECVKAVHAKRSPAAEKAEDESTLLGRRDWTKADIPEFEEMLGQLEAIDEKIMRGEMTDGEGEREFRALMLSFGGDPWIYGSEDRLGVVTPEDAFILEKQAREMAAEAVAQRLEKTVQEVQEIYPRVYAQYSVEEDKPRWYITFWMAEDAEESPLLGVLPEFWVTVSIPEGEVDMGEIEGNG